MGQPWFVSDPHAYHKNIIKYCQRPFASVYEMNEVLVANHNAVVSEKDDVYILGDLVWQARYEPALAWVKRLNGRLHFIEGNHDQLARQMSQREPHLFASYQHYKEIRIDGQLIVLFHYPMRSWHHAQKGAWHLYGHCHNLVPPLGKSVDVGVDNTGMIVPGASFRPVSFEELKAFMDQRPIGSHEMFPGYTPQDNTPSEEVLDA